MGKYTPQIEEWIRNLCNEACRMPVEFIIAQGVDAGDEDRDKLILDIEKTLLAQFGLEPIEEDHND